MTHVAVVTDGAACMPPEVVGKYEIHVVPFQLNWEGESLRDGVDITPTEFYRRLRVAKRLPTTSQPAVGEFVKLFSRLSQEAEAIASIHIAQEFTGTYKAALLAAQEGAKVPIEVMDSRTAAMAQGFVVLEAARAVAQGADLTEVVRRVKALIPRVHLLACLDTLEYLRRSGRVRNLVALLGSALSIKAVFHLYDGQVRLFKQVRSRERAMEAMMGALPKRAQKKGLHVAVLHADAPAEAKDMEEAIASRFDCREVYIAEFTPVMGVHTGPGVLGLAFYVEG